MSKKIHRQRGFISIRLILILFVGVLPLVAFKLFEPIFVYNWGWEKLPHQEATPLITDLKDENWSTEATKSENLLSELYKTIDAPAISVAVAVDGELVWRSAIGFADMKEQRAISFEDQFRLGSTSKAVTSVAVAVLADHDRLQFGTSMGEFDPSLAEHLRPVTLAQAMSHRAGIRNYGLCLCFPVWEHLNKRAFGSIRESIGVIEKSPLLHEPGRGFQYTSLGYNLAGLAVERATGMPFAGILEEEVFAPLGMSNSSLEVRGRAAASQAIPYEIDSGRYKEMFAVDNSIRWPSGGILSTPTDMVRLGGAMLDDRLLSDEVRTKILTIPEGGRENGGEIYALGWRVSDWPLSDELIVKSYNHNGTAVGSVSVFVVFPDQNIVVSAMMNKNATSISELARIVGQLAFVFMREDIIEDK